MSDSGSILKSAAGEVAKFGLFRAEVIEMIFIVVGVILFVLGVILLLNKTTMTKTVQGTVTKITSCSVSNEQDKQKIYDCLFNVDYVVDNKNYSVNIYSESVVKYSKGQKITLYYDPKNPEKAAQTSDDTHTTGALMMTIALGLVLMGWFQYYITKRFKAVQVVSGGSGLYDLGKAFL